MTNPNTSRPRERSMSIHVRAASLDANARTVEMDITTEAPVMMWGVKEILLMSGATYPDQVPMLDAHSRSSIEDVLGSISGITTEGGKMRGVGRFASGAMADRAIELIEEGHLTDVSAGYSIEDDVFIGAGKKEIVEGKEYEGPVYVVRKWRLREVSLVPIGADEAAKMRAAHEQVSTPESPANPSKEGLRMDPNGQTPETPPVVPATPAEPARGAAPATPARVDPVIVDQRHAEVRELCKLAGLSAERTLAYLDDTTKPTAKVREEILAARAAENQPRERAHIEPTADARDKFRAAAVDAVLSTAGLKVDKPAAGYEELRGMKLSELAREALGVVGVRAPRHSDELFMRALERRGGLFRQGMRSSGVYNHSTSDFPLILADVVNKAIGIGYQAAPVTYPLWTRAVPFSDFKTRHVPRLSSVPDPGEVTETGEIPEVALSEAEESYGIVTYGNIVSITRKTLINDDIGAFTRIPNQMGNALRRKFQKLVSGILNGGAGATYNMGDGNPLFDATNHANYGTTGTALAEGTLQTAWTSMASQTGLGGERIAITPRWLIIPPNLIFTARKLLESSGAVTSELNAGVINPLKGMAEIIVDPFLLDAAANSTTAYSLIADNNQVDTVEVGLLNGVDAPAVEEQEGFEVLGMRFRIFADFGAKAIDWRGMYKATGQA